MQFYMNRKQILILIGALLIHSATWAQNQFPSQVWHKGQIQTVNGQTFQGWIKYDLDNNIVQMQDQQLDTFSPINVVQFEIYDETYGGIRSFYSLPFSLTGDYETPVFFEVLTQGSDIALLCREYIATDNRGMGMGGMMMMNPVWGPPMVGGYRLAFNYYFLKDGRIRKYSQRKKELLDILADRSDEVDLYMRKNRLSHDKRGDLLRITAYYNQLR
jgi:hypothetical protein